MKMVTIKLPKWLSNIVLRFMKSSKKGYQRKAYYLVGF